MQRSVSVLCLVGALLAIGVGPGISLARCSFTGRVSIDCCCEKGAGGPLAALRAESAGCCTVQNLSAPWASAQAPSGGGVTAPALFASSLPFVPSHAGAGIAPRVLLASSPPDRPLPLRI